MTLIFQKIKKYQFDLNVKNNQNEKNIGNFCKKFTIFRSNNKKWLSF